MTDAIYNENEPFACRWLDELAARGHIAAGRVDPRSIADLAPADVAGPGQRHFFAGIGVWSYALRLAGVSDDTDVWTGSCPCQPFSDAGPRGGVRDPRHLWPAWFRLIEECRPPVVFGEQVASVGGLAWLDLVRADMERCGYAFGASDLCAAGVGAPHLRQRLFFVAYADGESRRLQPSQRQPGRADAEAVGRGEAGVVGNPDGLASGWDSGAVPGAEGQGERTGQVDGRSADRPRTPSEDGYRTVDDADLQRQQGTIDALASGLRRARSADASSSRNPWGDADWLPCTDGKSRPVEPGTFPLAHGSPARVGRLRGYGNAIVAEVAATFIEAALDAIDSQRHHKGHMT